MIFFITSGSLVYFIKESYKEVINKVLPSKCDEYPYLNPVMIKIQKQEKQVNQITEIIKIFDSKLYNTVKGYMPTQINQI